MKNEAGKSATIDPGIGRDQAPTVIMDPAALEAMGVTGYNAVKRKLSDALTTIETLGVMLGHSTPNGQVKVIKDDNATLRALIAGLLKSMHPHPKEHPSMYAAWKRAGRYVGDTNVIDYNATDEDRAQLKAIAEQQDLAANALAELETDP